MNFILSWPLKSFPFPELLQILPTVLTKSQENGFSRHQDNTSLAVIYIVEEFVSVQYVLFNEASAEQLSEAF